MKLGALLLAALTDRELVVADTHGALRLIDATGTMRTLVRDLDGPVVVEGGPFDTLYVADARVGSVLRFDAAGGNRTIVATGVLPIGLAVDERRNVYVSELAGRVLRIAPSGRRTVLVPRAG